MQQPPTPESENTDSVGLIGSHDYCYGDFIYVLGGGNLRYSRQISTSKGYLSSAADALDIANANFKSSVARAQNFAAQVRLSTQGHRVGAVPDPGAGLGGAGGLGWLGSPTIESQANTLKTLAQLLGSIIERYEAVEQRSKCIIAGTERVATECAGIKGRTHWFDGWSLDLTRSVVTAVNTTAEVLDGVTEAATTLSTLGGLVTSGGPVRPREFTVTKDTTPAPVFPSHTRAPSDLTMLSSLVVQASRESNKDAMAVRIAELETGSRTPVYAVGLGGTQSVGLPYPVGNPQDVEAMRRALVGEYSPATAALKKTILATIPPGSTLVLAGHSQGGSTITQLLNEREIKDNYQVAYTAYFGTPRETVRKESVNHGPPGIRLSNSNDIVPDLGEPNLVAEDLNGREFVPSNQVAELIIKPTTPALTADNPADAIGTHAAVQYAALAKMVAGSKNPTVMGALGPLNQVVKGAKVKREIAAKVSYR